MSYSSYPEYKESGTDWLGEVPSHWRVTRLKHAASVNMGQSPDSSDYTDSESPDAIPFLQGNAEFGLKSPTAKLYCQTAKKHAHVDDILLSVRAPVGALNVADQEYGIGRGLCAISPEPKTSRSLLSWALSSADQALDSIATGSTFEAVSSEQVENLSLAIPPSKEEQTQIARFLDHQTARIDALIAEQQRLIELLKEKRQAVISHAVTKGLDPDVAMKDSGVEWLGEVPEHWAVKRIKHILVEPVQTGPYGSSLTELAEQPTTLKLYGQENYITGDFDRGDRWIPNDAAPYLRGYRLVPGDIVFSRKGSLGNCRLVPQGIHPGIIDSDSIRVRVKVDLAYPDFVSTLAHEAWYVQVQFASHKRGAIVAGLNSSNIANLKVLIPPLEEQERIQNYVSLSCDKIGRMVHEAEKTVELLHERRSALISAAVTGKIDVRDWQPPVSEAFPQSTISEEAPA